MIGLADCEVYSYTPDIEFDPHANDLSDDEDDLASIGDEDSSTDDEETTFQFDDYDVDEVPSRTSLSSSWSQQHHPATSFSATARRTSPSVGSDEFDSVLASSLPRMRRRKGALLWSSHWFFLNRKLKRILFVSIWARSKGIGSWMDQDLLSTSPERVVSGERFFGWEGAIGAGARAMGLTSFA